MHGVLTEERDGDDVVPDLVVGAPVGGVVAEFLSEVSVTCVSDKRLSGANNPSLSQESEHESVILMRGDLGCDSL